MRTTLENEMGQRYRVENADGTFTEGEWNTAEEQATHILQTLAGDPAILEAMWRNPWFLEQVLIRSLTLRDLPGPGRPYADPATILTLDSGTVVHGTPHPVSPPEDDPEAR
jgi:hypothetical protein